MTYSTVGGLRGTVVCDTIVAPNKSTNSIKNINNSIIKSSFWGMNINKTRTIYTRLDVEAKTDLKILC